MSETTTSTLAPPEKIGSWADEDYIEPEAAGPTEHVVVEVVEKNGKKYKITKKIRLTKVQKQINKAVIERRKRWVKFGEVAGKPPGPEPGVTSFADTVEFAYTKKQKVVKAHEEQLAKEILQSALRKIAPSWAARQAQAAAAAAAAEAQAGSPMRRPAGAIPGTTDKYLTPSQRRPKEELTTTIRVTNLSEDATEEDLMHLFKPFGPIQRIFLAKDHDTGESKGFAFINYYHREDAQRAMDKLNGTGFGYLILNIEWARPSNK